MGLLRNWFGRDAAGTQNKEADVIEGFYVIEEVHGTKNALELFRSAAAGEKASIFEIARCFDESSENKLAFTWLKKAADLGNADAMVKLVDYYQGHFVGIEEDLVMADRYLKKAIELGSAKAYVKLAQEHYSVDDPEENEIAFGYYMQAAEMGDPEGQAEVGEAYLHGVGVEQDSSQAFYWLLKSTDDRHAAYMLAQCYLEGLGTPVDYEKATEALERAVKAGCVEKNAARRKLLELYRKGYGGKNASSKMARTKAELEASDKLLNDLAAAILGA